MTLRLSSTSGCKPFFERLVEDGRLSLCQKTDALKTARVLISNAVDPAKSQDPKFRRLKLGNAKLQQKIFSIPVMMELLQFVGFEHQSVEGEACLVMKDGFTEPCQACLVDLQVAQDRLTTLSTNININAPVLEKLTGKQIERRLLEEKERQDKLAAKDNRKRNLAMLKEDKRARHSDPNWKPQVSAACAKTGSGISTFRDKYGE
jgi:hypothetical protein